MEASDPTSETKKRSQDAINWTDEGDMAQVREKKRKLEEAEPYNDAGTMQKAPETGKAKAKKSIPSDMSIL